MNEETQGCGYTEDYCRRGYGCVLIIAALVSLVTSITALALCGAQNNHNDAGNSWAIGILGTLLTFAVTWSIWQVVDTKNAVKKAEEASKKLAELELKLETQRNLFNQHNLEIRHLIEAHAKLLEAEKTEDLSDRYISYLEAFNLLLQSNVSLEYYKFDDIRSELFSIINKVEELTDEISVSGFIDNERLYEKEYHNLITLLDKKKHEILDFKRKLTSLRDHRKETLDFIKKSDMGKRVEEYKKSQIELDKQLRDKAAARKAAEDKGD